MSTAITDAPVPTEEDPRWASVVARDVAQDGKFVYGVITTGVYCRPSCPSRGAKAHNVRFFTTPAEAEQAGLRACRRCHPNGPSSAQLNAKIVAQACRLIEEAEDLPRLEAVAASVGMSPYYFHRQFKAITGLTPHAYGAAHRGNKVRSELADKKTTVTDAIYGAGFTSSSRFYEQSNAILGMTPTSFKQGGLDVSIRFAIGQCSLGAVLVASSDKGICAITLGDDPEALIRDLQDRFPKADLIGSDRDFEQTIARVIGMVEAPRLGLDLPLDVRGTAFQHRVWQALREIPVGRTATYSDIAARIGEPGAVRAVAGACAANKIAVAIPCHRVIRSDGSLSGYRWGVERKRVLLEREAEP